MKYTFTCPAPDCGHTMTVEADTEDEALDLLLSAGDDHGEKVHPDLPKMSAEDAKQMVKGGMKKAQKASFPF